MEDAVESERQRDHEPSQGMEVLAKDTHLRIRHLEKQVATTERALEAIRAYLDSEVVVPSDVVEFGIRNAIPNFTAATYGAAYAEARLGVARIMRKHGIDR